MGWFSRSVGDFFSKKEEKEVVKAIRKLEAKTSAEIRVHLEEKCKHKDAYDRAWHVFHELEMGETKDRNGVLIYIAIQDHCFAIIGDAGFDEKLPEGYWMSVASSMETDFKEGKFLEGVKKAINNLGEQLIHLFPDQTNNPNQLPDEISYGKS